MAEYSIAQLEELQAAVDATPPAHRCPVERLWVCGDHPAWRIVRDDAAGQGPWWVIAPGREESLVRVADSGRWPAPTHAEALVVLRERQLAVWPGQPQEVPC